MGMTIEEFEEYAKSHNILIMTKEFYENRLKADMVAMLTEIQIEFDEKYWRDTQGYIIRRNGFNSGIEICIDIIQEKINALFKACLETATVCEKFEPQESEDKK